MVDAYHEYDLEFAPGGSKLNPTDRKLRNMVLNRSFIHQIELNRWINDALFSAISKASERERLRDQLFDNIRTGKVSFDLAHDQPATGVPRRTPDQVTTMGYKVVCLEEQPFMHYWEQIRSLLIETATGKQAPSSASSQKQQDSSMSLGDVQRLPDDKIRSFIKSISGIQEQLQKMPTQSVINRKWGYTPGTAFADDESGSEPDTVHL